MLVTLLQQQMFKHPDRRILVAREEKEKEISVDFF